ncbi:MAG: cyclic beta 1-2 glucan synthetase [Betaproteobacteria bacterium]|nr:cyclic beta 1-2 glucan synthetase [Betaproteobacteria bacterium]
MQSKRVRWGEFWRGTGLAKSAGEAPLRAELFSADQMEEHGRTLAAAHKLSPRRTRNRLLARLADNEAVLVGAGNLLKSALETNQRIAPAGEWLLDNFYLIEEQVRTARRHLPKAYSRELPRLLSGPSSGLPRAYDIALAAISHGDGRVDPESLRRFVAAYQTVTALKLGELWAIPIMLRLALIENLRRVSARIAAGTTERNRADVWADQMMEVAEQDPKSLILVTADMARSNPPMVSSFVAELARRLQGQSRALALPLTWIEQRLSESSLTIEQLVQSETQEQAADQVSMSNSIGSLRFLGAVDWREFVESMSIVERQLREDPVYVAMDFATRDRYRHVVEKVAKASPLSEGEVAGQAMRLVREASTGLPSHGEVDARASHVGFYLIDKGSLRLEHAAQVKVSAAEGLRRMGRRHSLLLYLGAIALFTGILAAGLMAMAYDEAAPDALLAMIGILSLLATSHLAVALVNRLATSFIAPHPLPRLDFSAGIPPHCRTLVVVPAMLTGAMAIEDLVEALEVRFLANRDDNLYFALLTDHKDAGEETLPEDAPLAQLARTRIEALNRKYGKGSFFLFHRARRWNPQERCWMGYERKRGKLAELNALLRGGSKGLFALVVGDTRLLANVKYVITLDTDTQLPRGAAQQLVATMAHPLNRPRYDEARQYVAEGYGILQPRMAVSLPGTSRSRYSRLCGSEPGIDPYTRTVSDVYQDLFGEGSFIGKGIYDVEAFERSLKGRFPENQILSHDLLEGCYVRSGLLSDVQLYEEYPDRYSADVKRRHRWIRGDWQIAQWLLSRVPGSGDRGSRGRANPLSGLSQWKIFDNLRRSVVPAALTLMLLAGWTILSPAWFWTVSVLGIMLAPPALASIVELLYKPADAPLGLHLAAAMRSAGRNFALATFALACLPHEAFFSLHAIARTAVRMLVTRTRLLEWTASSESDQSGTQGGHGEFAATLRLMWIGPVIACATAIPLAAFRPAALAVAAPILLLWLASPAIAWWLGRPRARRDSALTADETAFLRRFARKTWAFFDRFVGPGDHWLPPDNYQEQPAAVLAHRTSPTNMGFALLANLSAYDFGYITGGRLVERTAKTLATMQALERYQGHFYNWYDTLSLKPLPPLYISSVDSGNLACHLLTLRPGLAALCDATILGARWLEGFCDTLGLLGDNRSVQELETARRTPPTTLRTARAVVEKLAARAAEIAAGADAIAGSDMQEWSQALARQCGDVLGELAFLFPDASSEFPRAGAIPTLRELAALDGETGQRARMRIGEIERLGCQAGELAAMEYDFLFDSDRKLLSIGYNVAEDRRDSSFYDLLASEARAASFVAIAQGMLPQENWFALGRVLTSASGESALLSWSGSMFEYLMPLLVMPAYEDTLLDQTCRAAVQRQIAYGNQRGVPWGMSESGYNAVDSSFNYQYRAFGVPGLGLKRGLTEDLVVAPYASALALMVAPAQACANLQRLAGAGLEGTFGFYEAIDYTPSRLPRGQSSAVVHSYMAHHQGMILLSLDGLVLDRPMQKRFASEPLFQATMLLLQERIPKPTAFHSSTAGQFDMLARSSGPELPVRVLASADTPIPEVQLLSNGRYHVMVTNAGGGYSRWKDMAVTRWREDSTCDNWGAFCYLRDVASGEFWSSAHQPTLKRPDSYEAIFSEARAEFRRSDHDYETHTEIVVSPEDDIELRRLRITNRARTRRTIEVTSYAEVVLASPAADALHPGFSNLFVQTEILGDRQAILCTRRPRSATEEAPWMFHLMAVHGADAGRISYETDRARFIGRARTVASPQAMTGPEALSGSQGSVLDPIVAIRQGITLDPGQSATVDMVSGVGESRDACLTLVGKYHDRNLADRVFDLAWTHNWVTLRQINASESDAQLYGRLASSVLYANSSLRGEPGVLQRNRRGQSGLWGYAISGDLPIVLLQIADAENIELVRQLVQAHAYWRLKGLAVDLVIWNEDHAGYRQALQEQIVGLIAAGIEAHVGERPGGIFVRRAEQIADEDRILFQSVARAVLSDRRGTLAEQITRGLAEARAPHLNLPRFTPARVARAERAEDAEPAPRELILSNPVGGFSPDGTEYVITTSPGRVTPAPWVNVLANPHFGTVISESGLAYTWSENAHEFRLTPWNNDPVTDSSGEAFYIRDEESGEFWSPTALPCPGEAPYVTRHGFGYSIFEHAEGGIHSELRVYVDLETAVKFSALTVSNRSGRPRRLSATGYVEWVLGDLRAKTAMHVITEIDSASGALCAHNAYNTELAGKTAYFDVDDTTRRFTGDRTEFLGRNGTLGDPAALSRSQLSNKVGAALDPCGAIQVSFELADGQEREIVFRLGVAERRGANDAGSVARRLRGSAVARGALEKVRQYWKRTLGAVQVETPDPSLDVLANGWLLYQTLACRVWARSGYYQSGGAFGFRDQLQDVMALMHAEPRLAREHLLRCAAHQFSQGDVQHWWHPPSGRGVRTHCSDDYLWLAWATCRYVRVTGDSAVLDEPAHFLKGRPVPPEADSYYDLPGQSGESASLYQHCVRAIERGFRFGAHGLPLIGSGDWNDGMNTVGAAGKGESIWLGFFLYQVLVQFAKVARDHSDPNFAQVCEKEAALVRANIEKHGWDGEWYRRAYFDDGSPLGSAAGAECQIDSIAQSWSVLSGAGDEERSLKAMLAVDRRLVRREHGLVQLLDPPFDKPGSNPGYIKGYVPGVRENGGQYTHAAIWAAMAFAELGDSRRAWELFSMINPVNHALTAGTVATYKVEPYVVAADVYAVTPHIGRGGWTWYTGSAGWMYRLIAESLLGLRREGNKLRLLPCLPAEWEGFNLRYRYGETVYRIAVLNARGASAGTRVTVDGVEQPDPVIALVDDRQEHSVEVELDRESPP